MKKVLFAGWLLLAGLTACQNNTASKQTGGSQEEKTAQGEVDSLQKAVLDAHDRVMPKMNPMGRLRNRLQEAAARNPADSGQYQQAGEELARAQDEMKGWMRQFRLPEDSSRAFKKEYLKDQYRLMREIESLTNRSMEQAEKLLSSADSTQESKNK